MAEDGPDRVYEALLEKERATGAIGGWALPLQVDDPTGSVRRATAEADVPLASDSGPPMMLRAPAT